MRTKFDCYVLGCGDEPILGCRHKRFGLVSTCEGHNPIRHAMSLPLTLPAPEAPVLAAGRDEPKRFPGVRLQPLVPVLPPLSGAARPF